MSQLQLLAATLSVGALTTVACSSGETHSAGDSGVENGGSGGGGGGTAGASGASAGGTSMSTGGGRGGGSGEPATLDGACRDFVHAECKRHAECIGSFDAFNMATCLLALDLCPAIYLSDGATLRTAGALESCAADFRTWSCDADNNHIPPPCATPGTKQTEPCSFSAECASSVCLGTQGKCGTCEAPAPNNRPDLVLLGEGESCNVGTERRACTGDLICVPGGGAAGSTCQKAPAVGEKCAGKDELCASDASCNTSGTCVARVQVDQACSNTPHDVRPVCVSTAFCASNRCFSAVDSRGGVPCTSSNCEIGSACVNGTCTQAEPMACP